MLNHLRDWLKSKTQTYGFKFYLSFLLIGGVIYTFVLVLFLLSFFLLHKHYARTLSNIVRSQIEKAIEYTYADYLKKRVALSGFDEAVLEELLGQTRIEIKKEIDNIVSFHSLSSIGIKVVAQDEPKDLYLPQELTFEPLNFKIYIGVSKTEFYNFVLRISLIILAFMLLIFLFSLFILSKLYRAFRRPLDRLMAQLGGGDELSYTGYLEFDALISAIKEALEKERELVQTQHRLQLEIERRERLSAIGTMAGGYAHEFNNLLQMIFFHLELAERAISLGQEQEVKKHLENIKSIVSRGQNLAKKILYLTKDVPGERINLCEVLNELFEVFRTMVPREIELILTSQCYPPCKVPLSEESLKQILINLIKNAVDAIEALPQKDGIKKIEVKVQNLSEKEILFSVSDTGCGMTEEVKRKLFTPFFTTKGVGKGTGLGLYIVYNLVKNAGGRIEVESEPMKGSTFKIYLPVIPDEERTEEKIEVKETPKEEGMVFQRILVVDDEEDIRESLVEYLSSLGYHVESAKDGEEALELLLTRDYDLVLLDMFLPRMTGLEVLTRLKERGRVPKFTVMMTGYAGEDIESIETLNREGVIRRILKKPFSLKALEEILKGEEKKNGPNSKA